MPKFLASLLTAPPRRDTRLDLLDDRLLADMGMPRDQMRRVQPFLLGSLISR